VATCKGQHVDCWEAAD